MFFYQPWFPCLSLEGNPLIRPKISSLCYSRCRAIYIRPCSKATQPKQRPNFCIPSLAVVTSPYEIFFEQDVKHYAIYQSRNHRYCIFNVGMWWAVVLHSTPDENQPCMNSIEESIIRSYNERHSLST